VSARGQPTDIRANVEGIMDDVARRVLTVEDDDGIRTSLRLALEDEGYDVLEAPSAELAVDVLATNPIDVVLVDLMLPGASGLELVRSIRQSSDVPIVIVTARTDSHDVVAGLEAGADDYVRKPFVVKELEARLRALLRRAGDSPSSARGRTAQTVRFGALELAPEAGTLARDGEPVSLTRTEFRLLCELVDNSGLVLSREQLLERVWGYDYFGDARLVDAHIRRLRTKLEVDPSEPEFIVTVRGFGYKFTP
jgi:two-component system, OmpR family, response regulator MtrA